MNQKIAKDLLKIILTFGGLFLLVYVGLTILPEEQRAKWFYSETASIISYEKEMALGNLIAEYMIEAQEEDLLKNQVVDSAVWVVASRLQKELELTEYDYNIQVLDSPEINAFTIPGGRIYIFKGLLEFCDSPEELAAVLAHEMGHVENRHVVSKLVKEFGLTLLFSIIAGGDAVMLSDLWKSMVSSAFDRKQEIAADNFALKLLEKAKVPPSSMAAFFRKLNRENRDYDERMELLMSHPHNNARIKAALTYKTETDFEEEPIALDWEAVKAEVADD